MGEDTLEKIEKMTNTSLNSNFYTSLTMNASYGILFAPSAYVLRAPAYSHFNSRIALECKSV